jgi:prepilin-type N-terminal cleavage/methylation domain-containing protein
MRNYSFSQRHRTALAAAAGFTIVELLIASAISAVMMAMIANLTVHQIRLGDNFYTTATLNRRFRQLSDLLRDEFNEACLLRANADPRTTATAPDTPCNPEAVSPCGSLTPLPGVSTPAIGTDVRLLIPILNPATNTTVYRPVRYILDGTDLRRLGPRVNDNGTLDANDLPANYLARVGDLVMNNVAAFSTTVSPDCAWATLNVTLTLPGTSTTQARVLRLYSGADLSIT